MTWFAVYKTADGTLVSVGTELPATLRAGVTAKDFGNNRPAGTWNPATLVFDPLPRRRAYQKVELIQRFTRQERIAFRISTDQNVQDLWFVMFAEETINVHAPMITRGLDFLEAQGILAEGRADAIRGT